MQTPIVTTLALGVDPGTTQSAYALWDGTRVVECGLIPNEEFLALIAGPHFNPAVPLFIEMVESFGRRVGQEVFETVYWIGRFVEVWDIKEQVWQRVGRIAIKMHHCHNPNSNDADISQALRDKYGQVGTKKNPGPLYGVKKDIWSALAIASYGLENFCSRKA